MYFLHAFVTRIIALILHFDCKFQKKKQIFCKSILTVQDVTLSNISTLLPANAKIPKPDLSDFGIHCYFEVLFYNNVHIFTIHDDFYNVAVFNFASYNFASKQVFYSVYN